MKNTTIKKLLSLVLAVAIIICAVPLGAFTFTANAVSGQRADIIAVAQSQLGYQEGTNNNNKYGAAFGNNYAPWCAYFVSWCAKEAGISDSIIHRQGIASPFSGYFNIPNTHGRNDYFPQPGDLVFYGPNSNGDHYHVGIVETVNSSTGYITTIEGNTNSGGSSEGYTVYRHTRHYQHANICCYGIPNYTGVEPHTCNKGEYVYYEAAHPHYSCYKCSICGKIWRNTSEPNTIDGCTDCNKWNYYLDVWASTEGGAYFPHEQATKTSNGIVGNPYYVWYKLYDKDTGKIYSGNKNFTATISVYKPDDTLLYSYQYQNSACDWIHFTPTQIGAYKMNITLTGDIEGNYSQYLNVISDGKITFDKTSLTLTRPNNKTGTITLTLSGNWPEKAGFYFECDEEIISYTQDNYTIKITAKKNGTTTFRMNIVDKLNNNKLIAAATCQVTVDNKPYTIKYNANGGTGAPSSQIKYYDTTLTLSNTKPTREGYTFLGWGTSASDTIVDYSAGGSYTANTDDILYAIWKKTISLSYDANGGNEAPSSQSTNIYNSTTSKTFTISTTKPTRTGHTFLGWSKSNTATSASYSSGGNITLSDSDTLYAVWKPYEYTISYNANGGTGAPQAQVYEYGKSVTLSKTVPERKGYTFIGWATASNATTASYDAGGTYIRTGSISLYAVWRKTLYGDLDNNGVVEFSDALLLNKIKRGLVMPTSWQKLTGDLDGNGTIDDCDFKYLSTFVSDKTFVFPVERMEKQYKINCNAKKTTYYIGDSLDTNGLSVVLCYPKTNVTYDVTEFSAIDSPSTSSTGTKKVNISFKDYSLSYNITVKTPQILLSDKEISISQGRTKKLIVSTSPSVKTVTWTSSNTNVATVSSSGTITAKSEGSTTITAKFSYNGCNYSKSCKVNVTYHVHEFEAKVVAPTCIKNGYTQKTCKYCDSNYKTDFVDATGHVYKTTTTKATTSKNGKIVRACTVCGNVASTTTIKYAKSFKLSTTSYTYNGKVKTPIVTVKDSAGNKLKKNVDYTLSSSSGRKNVGTYKVTIKMKGKYSGTKTLTFKINPVKTTVSKLTAGKKSITVNISKKSTQVSGYQVQYSTSKKFTNAKTKTISSYKTTKYTLKSLSAKKTYYVRVRTYKTVSGKKYYSGWSTYKYVKTK